MTIERFGATLYSRYMSAAERREVAAEWYVAPFLDPCIPFRLLVSLAPSEQEELPREDMHNLVMSAVATKMLDKSYTESDIEEAARACENGDPHVPAQLYELIRFDASYRRFSTTPLGTSNTLMACDLPQGDTAAWWRERQREYPFLAQFARTALNWPATSAGPERVFSIAGHVLGKRRLRMTAQHVCDVVHLALIEQFDPDFWTHALDKATTLFDGR